MTEATAPITQDVLTLPRKLPEGQDQSHRPDARRAARGADRGRHAGAAGKMRLGQVWQWVYHWGVRDFAAMTNLAKEYRTLLADHFNIDLPEVVNRQVSVDGTRKYLVRIAGGPLNGGTGDDTMRGGAGADAMNGGQGLDFADYSDSNAAVSVNLATGAFSGGFATGDSAAGTDGIIGSNFNDTLVGFDGSSTDPNDAYTNIIYGGLGCDSISGLGGGDTLYGGNDADTVSGDLGDDRVFGDVGNDVLYGGAGNDTVFGGDDRDQIYVNYVGPGPESLMGPQP